MTKEQYEKWSSPFRKFKHGAAALRYTDKAITGAVFLAYPVLLAGFAFFQRFEQLFYCCLIPAVSFTLLSVFRKAYSAPRPYEVFSIQPLLKKETVGKSFPSRHVFSAFVIAMTFFYWNRAAGATIGTGHFACLYSGGRRRAFPKGRYRGGAAWHFVRPAVSLFVTGYSFIE